MLTFKRLELLLVCLVSLLASLHAQEEDAGIQARDFSDCATATFKLRNNRVYINGDVFKYTKLKTGQGYKDCLNLCRVVDQCWSFNYAKTTKFCYLISNDGAVLKSRRRSLWSSGYRQCVDHSDNNSWNNDAIDSASMAPYDVNVFVDLDYNVLLASWKPPSTAGRASGNHVTYKIKCGPENNDFTCDEKGTWEPDTFYTKTEIQPSAAGYRAFYDLFSMKCYIVYYMSGVKLMCSDAASVEIIPEIATANRECSRVQLFYEQPALPVVKYTAICTAPGQIRAGESIYLGVSVQNLSKNKDYSCIVNACTRMGVCKTIATAQFSTPSEWESGCEPAAVGSVELTQAITITYNSGSCPTSPMELKAIVDDLCSQARIYLVDQLGYTPDQISCSGTATCIEARRRSLLAGYTITVQQTVTVDYETQNDVVKGETLPEVLTNSTIYNISGGSVDPGPVTETVVPTLTVTTAANAYPFQRRISWTVTDADVTGISVTGYVVRCDETSAPTPTKYKPRNLLSALSYRETTVSGSATSAIIGDDEASNYNFALAEDTWYNCSVKAQNEVGSGVAVYANALFKTPRRAGPPTSVTTDLIFSDHDSWKATWTDGAIGDPEEKYYLKCTTVNDCTSDTGAVISSTGLDRGTQVGTLDGLTRNQAYYCFIVASNWAGDVCSAAATFETMGCACNTAVTGSGFSSFNTGNINTQNGWTVSDWFGKTDYDSFSGKHFDQAIVSSGGSKYWRVSSNFTSTSFSVQPHSSISSQVAGETGSYLWNDRGLVHTSPLDGTNRLPGLISTSKCFCGSFSVKSSTGGAQAGLKVGVSASAKVGTVRMFNLDIKDDGSTGYNMTLSGYPTVAFTPAQSGFDYNWHRFTILLEFKDGFANDISKIYFDGTPIARLSTWETYYQTTELTRPPAPRLQAVNCLQFRLYTPDATNTVNAGFYFDNVVVNNGLYP